MNTPLLQLRDVSAGYDPWPVVAEVSLQVLSGQVTTVRGPNAAGKTTLFRGLFAHGRAWLRGTVLWEGRPVRHLRDSGVPAGAVAWVRQDRPMFPSLTVEEVLRAAQVVGDRRERRQKLADVLNRLPEVRAFRTQWMKTLSGGQLALVSLAAGLVNGASLLCLDEPAANLDDQFFTHAREVVIGYVKQSAAGCLLIEHREAFAEGAGETINLGDVRSQAVAAPSGPGDF